MKALLLLLLLIGMSYGLYQQRNEIVQLRSDLDTQTQKAVQLQEELEKTKRALAAATANGNMPAYVNPLNAQHAPTPAPTASGSWMWQKGSLDSKLKPATLH